MYPSLKSVVLSFNFPEKLYTSVTELTIVCPSVSYDQLLSTLNINMDNKFILLMISIVIFYYCAAYGYTNFAEQSYPLTP